MLTCINFITDIIYFVTIVCDDRSRVALSSRIIGNNDAGFSAKKCADNKKIIININKSKYVHVTLNRRLLT